MLFFNKIIKLVKKNLQIIYFAAIGFLNTLVHGSVLVTAVELFLLDVTVSHFLAFCTANIFSYIMNSKLTFKSLLSFKRYRRFFLASLLSLGMTLLVSRLADMYGLHYLIGFILVIGVVPILSFLVMKFWTFAGKDKAE